MPLSTTGLQEGDFTALRVLKDGVMQDVLSLTAVSPDIPLGSLSIAQTSGLQAQLNAKATTAALTAAAESLGGEIDVVEAGVTAVATAVAGLSTVVDSKADASALSAINAAVAAKASQVQLSAVNSTLTTQLNSVSSSLGTKASTSSVTASLALKQDVIDEVVSFASGLFKLSGSGGTFSIL
jgi:peptidoglycan hydrolase-like amidase